MRLLLMGGFAGVALMSAPALVQTQSLEDLFRQGFAALRAEDYSQAERLWRQALRLDPSNSIAYIALGAALLGQGQFPEAEDVLREAVDLDFAPTNGIAYAALGLALFGQSQFPEAEDAFREAVDLDPMRGEFYIFLAYAYQNQDLLEEAIASYEQALRLDPMLSLAQNGLAEAQRLLALRTAPSPTRQDDLAWLPINEPLSPLLRSVVRVVTPTLTGTEIGTGFVVRREGNTIWVLTNRHVVTTVAVGLNLDSRVDSRALRQAGALSETVNVDFYSEPPAGRVWLRLPATIVEATGPQDDLDLALLMIDNAPDDIQPLALGDSNELPLLSDLLVVGHPRAALPWTTETSSLSNRDVQELQISRASLGPGNSGSPILNEQNQVVGILFSTLDTSAPGRAAGFGYAYRSDFIKPVLEDWGML